MRFPLVSSLLLAFLTLAVHLTLSSSKRAGSVRAGSARGSGASGARTTSYGATGRSGSVVNPDSGFSTSNGFSGGMSTVRRPTSGFSNSILKARDSLSHSMKNIIRPKAKVPRPSVSHPIAPLYNPSFGIMHSGRNKGLSTGTLVVAGVGGYFLGRMISRAAMVNPYNNQIPYGSQPYYYENYVPFRSRFAMPPASSETKGSSEETDVSKKEKNIELCMLHRWNQELPFTEIPNMAMTFLANNTISGNDLNTKGGFMYEFWQKAVDSYGSVKTPASIFVIPDSYNLNLCNFQSTEEPIEVAIKYVKGLYSNVSSELDTLRELIEAVQACFPQPNETVKTKTYPCLDYSVDPEKVLKLQHPDSIFNNDEFCNRVLSPRLFSCESRDGQQCSMHHLLSINMFARNFYLCSEAVHRDTVLILQDDAYLREYLENASSEIFGKTWTQKHLIVIVLVFLNLVSVYNFLSALF